MNQEIKPANIEVQTPMGTWVVQDKMDPDFPGISILIKDVNGCEQIAMFEYDPEKQPGKDPVMRGLLYEEPMHVQREATYVHDFRGGKKKIVSYVKQDEKGTYDIILEKEDGSHLDELECYGFLTTESARRYLRHLSFNHNEYDWDLKETSCSIGMFYEITLLRENELTAFAFCSNTQIRSIPDLREDVEKFLDTHEVTLIHLRELSKAEYDIHPSVNPDRGILVLIPNFGFSLS